MADATTLIEPVTPLDHVLGRPDAPLTLILYGDFECPYCREAFRALWLVEDMMEQSLQFVFRHFPLGEIHTRAFAAAVAAEAAGMQGKFWEMYEMLFTHQSDLSDAALKRYAAIIGLDERRFLENIKGGVCADKVRRDYFSARICAVNSTPTLFIGNQRYDGPQTLKFVGPAIRTSIARQYFH